MVSMNQTIDGRRAGLGEIEVFPEQTGWPLVINAGVRPPIRETIQDRIGGDRFFVQAHPYAPDGLGLPGGPFPTTLEEAGVFDALLERNVEIYLDRIVGLYGVSILGVLLDNDRFGVTVGWWRWAIQSRDRGAMLWVPQAWLDEIDDAPAKFRRKVEGRVIVRCADAASKWYVSVTHKLKQAIQRLSLDFKIAAWGLPHGESNLLPGRLDEFLNGWSEPQAIAAFKHVDVMLANMYFRKALWAERPETIRQRTAAAVTAAKAIANGRPVYVCTRCLVPQDAVPTVLANGEVPPRLQAVDAERVSAVIASAKDNGAAGVIVWENLDTEQASIGLERIANAVTETWEVDEGSEESDEPETPPQDVASLVAEMEYLGNENARLATRAREVAGRVRTLAGAGKVSEGAEIG